MRVCDDFDDSLGATLWDGRKGIVFKRLRDEEIEMIEVKGWYGVVSIYSVSGWLGIYAKWSPDRSFRF